MWGIYRERWKWEASISVSGYANASLLSKGRLALVYHDTPMPASHFCHVISHFLSSSNFWLDLCIAAWRPFRAMFSSIFICTKISRCLVSNSLGFVQFGVTIVEISRLKGRWRKVEKFWTFFFFFWKIDIYQSKANIIEPFRWKLAKTLSFKILQPAHFSYCPISTVYCMKSSKKTTSFLEKYNEDFTRVSVFCDISFISTMILACKLLFWRGKICSTLRSKIQHDPIVRSKSQLFDHTRLGFWS